MNSVNMRGWRGWTRAGMVLAMAVWLMTGAESMGQGKQPTDDELGEMLQRAVVLYQMGFYGEAEKACREILKHRPDQPTVSALLKQIQDRKPKPDPVAVMRERLSKIVIPELNVCNGAVLDVIVHLRQQSAEWDPRKKPVNFVLFIPPEIGATRVTLHLNDVPLLEAVRYVTMAANLRYYVDGHAIVIYHDSTRPSFVPASDAPSPMPDAPPTR